MSTIGRPNPYAPVDRFVCEGGHEDQYCGAGDSRPDLATIRERNNHERETSWTSHDLFVLLDYVAKLEAELVELREFEESRRRDDTIESLIQCSHLSRDEALRVYEHLKNGGTLEYESGRCRRCSGVGGRFGRGSCDGLFNQCTLCGGTGTESHRIKVPT